MKPVAIFFRAILLAVFTLSLLAGAIFTDYFLRHEVTRKAKRYLAEKGVDLAPESSVEAARAGEISVLEQLEIAGVDLGRGDSRGYTPLLAAIQTGNLPVVEFLMERPAAVADSVGRMTQPERLTPLSAALASRDFGLAGRLLDSGADLSVDAEPGVPFLISAVVSGDAEMIDYLLSSGVPVDYCGAQRNTALAYAAEREDSVLVGRLLEAGASADVAGFSGDPLLVESVRKGRREIFDLLLAAGADPDAYASDGQGGKATALTYAVERAETDVQDALLGAGASPDVAGPSGAPLVHEASASGDLDLVARLLAAGVRTEVLSSGGSSPLLAAVEREDLELVDLLLAGSADPSFSGADRDAPLLAAVSLGNLGIVRQLLEAGADRDGAALLGESLRRRDDPLMGLLLETGIDPESIDSESGERIFDLAVREGATGAVRTLLAAGAKIGDNLWAALLTGQDDLIRLILAAGASPRQPGPKGEDPLDYCLTNERYGAARILLAGGANPDTKFNGSETWLSKSLREGNAELALALVESGATVRGVRASDGHTLIGWALAHKMSDVAVALAKAGIDTEEEERTPARPEFREMFESTTFRYHLQVDSRIRPIMIAAAQRDHAVAQALMDAGANGRAYSRKYLAGAIVGAWYKDTRMQQICLLGKVPDPQPRKVVVNLSTQRVTLYENGVATFSTPCSTGKSGYRTPPGEYVISDKHRHHNSSIYGSSMPFFQRFSFGAFGLHQGHLPGYPASHGCIRLTYEGAQTLFGKLQVGDYAVIVP